MAEQRDPKMPVLDRHEHPYVFSASQIETADLCLRKWALDKIDKLPRPENPSLILGSSVHDQLEYYLRDARVIDTKIRAGKIAMEATRHLPLPRTPGMSVEEWFVLKYGEPLGKHQKVPTYWGKKDVEMLGGWNGLKLPIVWDHKTSKSFTWAKSERDLEEGIQSGLYAYQAMEGAGTDIAQLRWTYLKTEGAPKSLPVVTNISRAQALVAMDNIDRVARQLVVLRDELVKGEGMDAPPNYSACEAFGGCPYKEQCKPTAANVLEAIMEQKVSESLLTDLRNRKKKPGATPTTSVEKEVKETQKAKDKEETKDKVNPPDREDTPPPPPPEAKKAGGKWYQPQWDDSDWAWGFPSEYHEAVAADEAAAKEAEKAAKSAGKGGSVARASKKGASEPAAEAGEAGSLLDQLVDLIADRVVAKLAEKK